MALQFTRNYTLKSFACGSEDDSALLYPTENRGTRESGYRDKHGATTAIIIAPIATISLYFTLFRCHITVLSHYRLNKFTHCSGYYTIFAARLSRGKRENLPRGYHPPCRAAHYPFAARRHMQGGDNVTPQDNVPPTTLLWRDLASSFHQKYKICKALHFCCHRRKTPFLRQM